METEVKKLCYENGNLWIEFNYLEKSMHGIQKTYYPNGQIKGLFNKHNGNFHGTDQNWNDNSTRNYLIKYKKDHLEGPKIEFNYGD